MPGWEEGSYGFHGDDACIYSVESRAYSTPFATGDTVGCCLLLDNTNPEDQRGTIFFTHNGKKLGK
jgi:hypothetical protein